MQSTFDHLDKLSGWIEKDHCCWLAQRIADWAQYQYRYVVPTWLVEQLLENQNLKISHSYASSTYCHGHHRPHFAY